MSWENIEIKDICKYVTSGGTPLTSKENYYFPPQIPWLKTKEVNYCRITDVENYISQEGLENSSAKLIPVNSVIVAMYGQGDTAGRVAINKIPLATNQACCNLVIDEAKADYRFIYYSLSTLYDKLVSLKNGGAQPNLNANIIKKLKLKLPDLEMQNKIANILSAYDTLIENNQKQIKLLEEMAQRLYKEWFVDLRFPNYENTPIVDGVPQGWSKVALSEVAMLSAGGDKPNMFSKEKTQLCNIPVYSNGTENEGLYGYTDRSTINDDCVTISARGNVGYTCLRKTPFVPIVRLITVIPKNKCAEYLFFFLKNMKFKSNGAAQQQITVPMIKNELITIPTTDVLIAFKSKVSPIFDLIKYLKIQNENCAEARDRLLPKLMSGEIDI